MNNTSDLPTVSIIVPVYNAEQNISILLRSLLNQDYPKEQIEIIIVDNNSTDKTKEIVNKYPVTLLEENTIQSSYAARNVGIKHSKGEILAFIDSDCIAGEHWIKYAISCLNRNNADIIAGNIQFISKSKLNIFELYDSHYNLQQKYYASIGGSTTANLLIRRSIFKIINLFPIIKSGGDIKWTKMATNKGYKLFFCEQAILFHPARNNLQEIIEKELRSSRDSSFSIKFKHFSFKHIQGKVFAVNKKNLRGGGLLVLLLLLKNTFKLIAMFMLLTRYFSKKLKR